LRPTANPSVGGYFWIRSSPSTYANGSRVTSADSGATWTADTTRDFNFKAYMQTGFAASGDFVSSQKDANPAQDYTATWSTLSWNASTPANTALKFQVAASNSAFGPFNFVGPDNTAATFFTSSGASLNQFNGNRYLQYHAFLSTTDSTMTPTVNDVTTCFVDNAPADLSISKDDGTATAAAGGSVTYTITASNAGPGAANNATVTDNFPADETCNWTCTGAGGGTCTASGAGNILDSVNLPVGGTATYSATCGISLTASGSLSNTASISGASAFVVDTVPGNNSATDTDGVVQSSDLSISKTDGVTTATPGGSVTYMISAFNAGPSNAPGSTVADTFPASLTCTWTCLGLGGGTCTASGSGNINDTTNLPAGSRVTYTASCTIAAAATGSLSNTATATVQAGASDPNPGDNSATDTDTLTPQADLAITKTDGVTTATPGGSVTYTITASNAGPSDAPGATVADTFPASLTCTWTCVGASGGTCTASGSGNINDTVNLPAGGSTTHTASCTISAAAAGTLSNTATVTATGGVTDPTPGNNSATDSDTLAPQADLAITKTDGVTTATPGGSVTYTITASNAGPSNATGATVADTFPASETCMWTCVGAGGATCTASGSGNINDSANLPSGGSTTYSASCAISASAAGTLSNTASVSAPGGVVDPTPGNNSATDTDSLVVQADIAVTTYTDHRTYVQLGDTLDYIIFVTNSSGPSNASVNITDALPPWLGGGVWNCVAAPPVTCTSGTGNTLSDNVTLPVGGFVAYVYSTTVLGSDAGEQVTNSVSANLASGTDPTPANNTASDTDIVVIFRDDFEGTPKNLTGINGSGDALVSIDLRVDAGLLANLSIVPVEIANGLNASGKTLFTLELARFGNDYVLRTIVKDADGRSERTAWQTADMSARLVSFDWQSAATNTAGYLSVNGGGAALSVSPHHDQDRLTGLSVTVENNVPWLVLIAH
jgi:uncharacterized repeat protein (TIGR01451 family)